MGSHDLLAWYIGQRLMKAIPKQVIELFVYCTLCNNIVLCKVTSALQADVLWSKGFNGCGIKVAIFDTGLSRNHPNFRHIRERTDWTDEQTLEDSE